MDQKAVRIYQLGGTAYRGKVKTALAFFYEILHFATQCRHGINVPTLDDFNHIFEIHKKYNELLKANNLTNGQMDVEYDFIIRYYNTLSRDVKL